MISIVIPAYNEENYIEKTLKSIENQPYKDYETIVVANGCTDRTVEIAQKYPCKIIELNEPNVSKARNAGAQAASNNILLFIDADTRLSNDTLSKISAEFKQPNAVATTLWEPNHAYARYRLAFSLRNLILKMHLYHGSAAGTIITWKDSFLKAGGFDSERNVSETKQLIDKLIQNGSYKVINTSVTVSTRRFEKWGIFSLCFFWIKQRVTGTKKLEYEAIR